MKKRAIGILRAIGLGIFLVVALFPLIWIFLTSIKPATEVYTFPVKYLPSRATFEAYRYLFSFARFNMYFKNSFVVATVSAGFSTFFSLMAGYVLTRERFKLRTFLILVLFFVQMLPTYLIMIPQFTMFSRLKLTNTLTSVIIIYTGFGSAFGTIMARAFLKNLPRTIEEAALIDGCNRFQALFRVVIPLLLPGVGSIFSFCFVNSWNEVFTAVLFLHTDSKMTVPVALYSFVSKAGIQWNVMAAGIIVALLPTIVVFSLAQKYIVEGLTQGAIKA
ncbi:sugar ABC transporter permease [Pseudothermotoga hypogea DSM 11164 = NBRC 106472]|uniref:Sugar ABC transporter permease n=2 Tax=Pseudothermotoga hypogea TaxID=57487 RepID=A0A0X1KRH7_9THEM|nr:MULTISPECIES: carbohydrate ABC transporter permease [Pseudothermotoga]AJC73872.1 sugar ABC transporter permease [Pseudothermotoga hypogea DSM 11164 = NBRC 106472]MDI6863367.1 carbohydrate ABC transporter permease [Pseudothermotoga sp.]